MAANADNPPKENVFEAKPLGIQMSVKMDGPFMEAKEVLGGYSVLETDTYEEAVEISKTWPGVDRGLITIELRPVVEF